MCGKPEPDCLQHRRKRWAQPLKLRVTGLESAAGTGQISGQDIAKLEKYASLFDPNISSTQQVQLGNTEVSAKDHELIIKQMNTLRAKTPGDAAGFAAALKQKGNVADSTAQLLATDAKQSEFTNLAELYGSGKIAEADIESLKLFAQRSSGPQDFTRNGVSFVEENRQMTDLLNMKNAQALKVGLQFNAAAAAAARTGNFIEFTEFLDEIRKNGVSAVGQTQLRA